MPGCSPDSRPRFLLSRVGAHARPTRQLAWLALLLVGGLAAVAAIAASDPDWNGTQPQNMSNSLPNRAWQPVIAAGSAGHMVMAWSDQSTAGSPRNIYVRRSFDSGHIWTAPQVLSATMRTSAFPDAVAIGSRDFVVWVDQQGVGGPNVAIYEAEIGAGKGRLVPSPTGLTFTQPRLATGASTLHVVFNAGSNILHAMRSLAATAWPTATRIYTSPGNVVSEYPVLATGPDGKTLHVVWQDYDLMFSKWTIIYKRGTVNGAAVNWTSPYTLATGGIELKYPDIAADSRGNLHVVWGEVVGPGNLQDRDQYVRYTRYNVATSQWISPAVRIDNNPVRVNTDNPTYTAPNLALREKGGQVEACVAWHGFRAGGMSFAEEVLLSCSPDGGRSWPSPRNVSRSPQAEALSLIPSIAFDASGQLHAVWQEHNLAMGGSVVFDYQVYHSWALSRRFLPLVGRK